MARRKEVQLQEELKNQEQFDDFLSKKGVGMIDVFQAWAGPCAAVNGMLRRIKNELGDDLLRFATAEADNIEALERYRGKCQPTFLFYAGGELVHVIRGANAPLITKAIPDLLKAEHSVLEDGGERKVITDPLFDQEDKEAEEEAEEEEAGEEEVGVQKEVTVAIIKPDAVQAGHVEDIIQRVKDAGFEILAQEERMLTEEEAREFYGHKADEEFFDELVAFMASGPSHVLVLSKGDSGAEVIDEWRKIIGPFDSSVAKEEAPDSLRAQYGTDKSMNALHGSDSHEMATRELAFFFPNFQIPKAEAKPAEKRLQRTLALIRPDALKDHKDEILAKIQEAGFTVALQKEMQLTKDQAAEFYKEHEGQDYFEQLVESMTSGPLLALGLAREDAVERWRDLLGPKEVPVAKEEAPDSLRAQFAVEDVPINQLHGSDSMESAEKEVQFFFPMQQTLAVVKPDAQEHKEDIVARIKEAGFNIAFQKETSLTEELAQQLYKEHEDKEFFGQLVEHMTSGQSLFMVLSLEDAVDKFRSLMGPTDPEVAKEQFPDSLRAQFASDMLRNALHGSSNPESAQEKIKAIFGDIDFNPDGTVKGMEPELDMITEGGKEPAEGEEGEEGGKEGEGEGGEQPAEEGEKKEEGEKQEGEEGEKPAEEAPAAEEQKEEAPEGGEEAKPEEQGNEGEQEGTNAEQEGEERDENEQKEGGENEGSEQAEGNEGEKESPEEGGATEGEAAAEPAEAEGGDKQESESAEKESEEKPEGGETEAEAAPPAEEGGGEGEGEKAAEEEKPAEEAEQKEGEGEAEAEKKPSEEQAAAE